MGTRKSIASGTTIALRSAPAAFAIAFIAAGSAAHATTPTTLSSQRTSAALSDPEIAVLKMEIAKLEREKREMIYEQHQRDTARAEALFEAGFASDAELRETTTRMELAMLDLESVSIDVKRLALRADIAADDADGRLTVEARRQAQLAEATLGVETSALNIRRAEIRLDAAQAAYEEAIELAEMGMADESHLFQKQAVVEERRVGLHVAKIDYERSELRFRMLADRPEEQGALLPIELVAMIIEHHIAEARLEVEHSESEIVRHEIEIDLQSARLERTARLAERDLASDTEVQQAELNLRTAELSREQMRLQRGIRLKMLDQRETGAAEALRMLEEFHARREQLQKDFSTTTDASIQDEMREEIEGLDREIMSVQSRLLNETDNKR